MKKLITICAVIGLMLSAASVSWAVPTVTEPPGAPGWWNAECDYYAYGWWSDDITVPPGATNVSPPNDVAHWASNFLLNTAFEANVFGNTITIELDNVYRPDLIKEIYIYLSGTTSNTEDTIIASFNPSPGFHGQGHYPKHKPRRYMVLFGERRDCPSAGLVDADGYCAGDDKCDKHLGR